MHDLQTCTCISVCKGQQQNWRFLRYVCFSLRLEGNAVMFRVSKSTGRRSIAGGEEGSGAADTKPHVTQFRRRRSVCVLTLNLGTNDTERRRVDLTGMAIATIVRFATN